MVRETDRKKLPGAIARWRRHLAGALVAAMLAGGGGSAASAAAEPDACAPVSAGFKPGAGTKVISITAYGKGDALEAVRAAGGGIVESKAAADLCRVRLLVGPGNPGPADAPSTSDGIGVEVWLPPAAAWTGRVYVMGGGGSSAKAPFVYEAPQNAVELGAVVAFTDGGRRPGITETAPPDDAFNNLGFLLNPDGRISPTQWRNWGHEGIHQAAVKAKALATLLYGRKPRFSYFVGGSGGGRQAHMAAQVHPEDFDGIVAGSPANNWTQFLTLLLYPQVVMQQDLGGALPFEKLSLASAAAISACDSTVTGRHDGYVSDPTACRYDPTKDQSVLCVTDGGENTTAACLKRVEATAINKMWYGQTVDGSVPDPAVDNGTGTALAPGQLWFGAPRGTSLMAMATSINGKRRAFLLAAYQLAVTLQDPKLGPPTLLNATGNGQDGWLNLTYADLARARSEAKRLQKRFGPIDADDPDLRRFKAHGGKMLVTHGLADSLIPVGGMRHYHAAVVSKMGGLAATRQFYRYFEIPGWGHGTPTDVAGIRGVSPPPDAPTLPQRKVYDQRYTFLALADWVEKGIAPETLVATNAAKTVSRPICLYPRKQVYRGGDESLPANYECR